MRQNNTATSPRAVAWAATIVIYCADQKLRESLTKAVREDETVALAGAAGNPVEFLELIDRAFTRAVLPRAVLPHAILPHAILADTPPGELLAEWRRRHDHAQLIVLLENPETEAGIDALDAGAHAILSRASAVCDIIRAIKTVAAGYAVMPLGLLSRLFAAEAITERSLTRTHSERPQLTPRELDVIAAMADGASNKTIARRLGISFHTVKFHVASVLAKLDADTRTEAVAKAAQLGVVML